MVDVTVIGRRLDMAPYISQKFFMPWEGEQHDACWIGWPTRRALWGERMDAVKRDHALIAQTISRFEPVIMACRPEDREEVYAMCGDAVQIWPCALDDSWLRDSGPTFLVGDHGGLAIVDWKFNAWGGKYEPHAADAALKRIIAERLGLPLVTNRLVAEGGALVSDGEGTIITTESCLLHANRNAHLDRREVEAELLETLGAEKVVWLPGDPSEVETNGHVDCIASFVTPGCVMMPDPRTASGALREMLEQNRQALAAQTDARGRQFEILDILAAPDLDIDDPRYQASYLNYYLANGAVIMPAHGVPQDATAKAMVEAAFPTREVVQLRLHALPYGGGAIHCVTQQQPSRRLGLA